MAILHALIAGMTAIDAALPAGIPNPDAARARLDAGICALEGEPLLSPSALLANVRILERQLSVVEGLDVSVISPALSSLDEQLTDVTFAALAGAWADLGAVSDRIGVEEFAFITLVDYATRPALQAGRRALTEVLATAPWDHGRCPACGAPPALGELCGGDGERFLRCGRCAASWSFARVGCPLCETRDHTRLAYLHGDGEELHRRAQTCDQCRGYVKEIAVLDPLTATAILEMDLASAGLDLAAVERGFHR